ncbi:hypothetical protein KUL42_21630 [Alteromonas sp. KUL42]|nr:hypothetical protein KUL42_21630 [Alteromonas sp. KUL42]
MKVKISGHSAQEIFESVRELTKSGDLQTGDSLPPRKRACTTAWREQEYRFFSLPTFI